MKNILAIFLMFITSSCFAQTKFGVLVNGPLPLDTKIKVARELGVTYVRDAVIMQNWKGDDPRADRYLAAGFKLILNVNWGPAGNKGSIPFPKDTNTYKEILSQILDKYHPELVVVENEEIIKKYHSGPIEDYINELTAAVGVAHSKGLKVTNGGLTNRDLALLVYNHFKDQGSRKDADDFARRCIKPGLLQPDNAEANQMVSDAQKLVNAYRTLPLDYVNIHIYEPIKNMTGGIDESAQNITPGAITAIIRYIETVTGKKTITNESGTRTSSPAVVTQMLQAFVDAKMDYIVWFSGDATGGAIALQDEQGELRPNGEAFRKFVAEQTGK